MTTVNQTVVYRTVTTPTKTQVAVTHVTTTVPAVTVTSVVQPTVLYRTTIGGGGGGGGGGPTELTGDVTGAGTGTVPTTIAAGAVTLAKLANLPAFTVIGNDTVSAATPAALSKTQLTTLINVFTSLLSGAVPASGGGTTNFLRADGVWAAPPGGGGGGTIGGTAASGQVAYGSGANTLTSSSDFLYSSGVVTLPTLNAPILQVSANTTLGATHHTVLVDATAGPVTITLPLSTSTNTNGRIYIVKKVDSSPNAVTVARSGSELIDGAVSFALTVQYQARYVQAIAASSAWVVL